MKYQLVLQFRGDALADYDAMIVLEDRLIEDFGRSATRTVAEIEQRSPS